MRQSSQNTRSLSRVTMMLIRLALYYHSHLLLLSMGLFCFFVLVGNSGVAAVLLIKPPHSLRHFPDFGCVGPAWMGVWRLQGDRAQTGKSGCAPGSDCWLRPSRGCGPERSAGISPAVHLLNGPAALGFSDRIVSRFRQLLCCNGVLGRRDCHGIPRRPPGALWPAKAVPHPEDQYEDN